MAMLKKILNRFKAFKSTAPSMTLSMCLRRNQKLCNGSLLELEHPQAVLGIGLRPCSHLGMYTPKIGADNTKTAGNVPSHRQQCILCGVRRSILSADTEFRIPTPEISVKTKEKRGGKSSEPEQTKNSEGNAEAEKSSEAEAKPESTSKAVSKENGTTEATGEEKSKPEEAAVVEADSTQESEGAKDSEAKPEEAGAPEEKAGWDEMDPCQRSSDGTENKTVVGEATEAERFSKAEAEVRQARRRQRLEASVLSLLNFKNPAHTRVKNLVLERCDRETCNWWLVKVRKKKVKDFRDCGTKVVQEKGKADCFCLSNTCAPSRWSEQRGGICGSVARKGCISLAHPAEALTCFLSNEAGGKGGVYEMETQCNGGSS
ncbi:uncharacterized protein LOC130269256 [Hyla sarda]|uniref:uncharacterized protein LOC130269256 n=1 Tax=Hyla sarda TaxID=327740 RepID=UPI0024C2C877|nr:uncharacterized protein LOC130269256 [Hyla sarda]